MRGTRFSFYVSEAELAEIKRRAGSIPASTYVRMLALGQSVKAPDLVRQSTSMLANANKIAQAATAPTPTPSPAPTPTPAPAPVVAPKPEPMSESDSYGRMPFVSGPPEDEDYLQERERMENEEMDLLGLKRKQGILTAADELRCKELLVLLNAREARRIAKEAAEDADMAEKRKKNKLLDACMAPYDNKKQPTRMPNRYAERANLLKK